MGKKTMRAYAPPWVGWFVTALLLPIWLAMGYAALADLEEPMPLPLFLAIIVMFALILVVASMLATQGIPAYLIEIDDDGD